MAVSENVQWHPRPWLMATHDAERLSRLLGGERLARLRGRLRRRFATQQPPADGFTLTHLKPAEVEALAGLLGRPPHPRASMRLSHTDLDAALSKAGLADNLRAALEYLDGPITDTAAARERSRRVWADTFAQSVDPRLARMLDESSGQGLVKRLSGREIETARGLITQTDRVLARLPEAGISLARLAADTLGDAHALDIGRPAATLVRRALIDSETRVRPRELWASQGVLVNELAKPVATLNLPVDGHNPGTQLISRAAMVGEPLHLSLRLLTRHTPAWRAGQYIYVCENPEVLAAAADALGSDCPPMICLDGQLSAAPAMLLDQLAAAGAHFFYHGDFDWPGLHIANYFIARYGAEPWRYAATDYEPGDGPSLLGNPVEAVWDTELATRMHTRGIAIHEESQLNDLIADLARVVS